MRVLIVFVVFLERLGFDLVVWVCLSLGGLQLQLVMELLVGLHQIGETLRQQPVSALRLRSPDESLRVLVEQSVDTKNGQFRKFREKRRLSEGTCSRCDGLISHFVHLRHLILEVCLGGALLPQIVDFIHALGHLDEHAWLLFPDLVELLVTHPPHQHRTILHIQRSHDLPPADNVGRCLVEEGDDAPGLRPRRHGDHAVLCLLVVQHLLHLLT
mmetsp:Transcript_16062/g.32542  ORF Transcript_16062/g.32542 Transcript_16062/m.32542 type:complete len:214 (+) Transcript_16062:2178-2819(+)